MQKFLTLAAILILTVTSCDRAYRETSHGIIVNKNVRLEVVNDNIIRVSATAKGGFPRNRSLITTFEYPEQKDWTVSEEADGSVTLTTAALKAMVSPQGNVTFLNPDGSVILREKDRTVEPSLHQVWESAPDEAYYGLGQHQSDEFNYKDKNELLIQYNTKVTIPFIMSTHNYGILWDNYSMSRWGDSRDYAQINEVFKVYDASGAQGGLTGTYTSPFPNVEKLVRSEPFIYFENIQANREYLPQFPLMGADVVFEGYLQPSESGLFKFMLYYAGYMKVYVDDELIVPERWRTAWNPNTYKFACNMEAGRMTPIRIEWRPDGGESYCSLRALSPRPAEDEGTIAFWSEAGDQIDYYFIKGNNLDGVISGYRTVTGKSQIMAKWAMGFWQCRERYKTQDELVSTLKELRGRNVPVDNIVQDWFYWREDDWGSHEFDPDRYPDPQKMVNDVHDLNGHLMISVWPKFYVTTEHYKEFDSKGWMYRQAVKDSLRDWVGPGYLGSFYDAYSKGARDLFWKQMNDHLVPFGFDAWWMDASEPNIKDCVEMDYWKKLCGPTDMGSSTEYLNAYGLLNADAIYNGQRSVDPNRRVFLLTRSGFAGIQRYSTSIWSGDIASRWEDMKAQISAGINFSMSGVPYWSQDIGGFCVENRYVKAFDDFNATGEVSEDLEEWREMNARWFQFGAFCPIFRVHGQYPTREIWNIAPQGHPAYSTILEYDRLRYRLMPYIYSLAGMTWFDDYTIMRGLAMDFESDSDVFNIGDQYMFGPSLMVNPVYTYMAREREVYFPENEGGWYDFYTNANLSGGVRRSVPAPYDRMPLYVPAGSIIPMGPDMQYTSEKPADVIDLYVYTGKDGKFTLYEDEGTNYDYEQGLYTMIDFTYDNSSRKLTIGERQGEYPQMLSQRTFMIHFVNPSWTSNSSVQYNGKAVEIQL